MLYSTSSAFRPLTEDYQAVLKEEFDRFMADKCGRKSKEEVQQKLITMQTLLQLYSEGVEKFEGDLHTQLEKFLLRSFGQEITAIATTFALLEAGIDENSQVTGSSLLGSPYFCFNLRTNENCNF